MRCYRVNSSRFTLHEPGIIIFLELPKFLRVPWELVGTQKEKLFLDAHNVELLILTALEQTKYSTEFKEGKIAQQVSGGSLGANFGSTAEAQRKLEGWTLRVEDWNLARCPAFQSKPAPKVKYILYT